MCVCMCVCMCRYLKDGEMMEVEGAHLLDYATKIDMYPGFALEGLPNRDSLMFMNVYNLDQNVVRTLLRGTLRYRGFSKILRYLLPIHTHIYART